MKTYISPEVHEALFGNDSPNEVLKELVRWMASPSYQNFLVKRGLHKDDSWVDVFKMALLNPQSDVAKAQIKQDDGQDLGSDLGADIEF